MDKCSESRAGLGTGAGVASNPALTRDSSGTEGQRCSPRGGLHAPMPWTRETEAPSEPDPDSSPALTTRQARAVLQRQPHHPRMPPTATRA